MTILQYLQSKTEPGTKIPMRNITNLMNNAGYSFNWEALEGLKKQFPALDELIGDANEDYITIGKSDDVGEEPLGEPAEQPEGGADIPPPDMGSGPTAPTEPSVNVDDGRNPERATVDKMAARAARF